MQKFILTAVFLALLISLLKDQSYADRTINTKTKNLNVIEEDLGPIAGSSSRKLPKP